MNLAPSRRRCVLAVAAMALVATGCLTLDSVSPNPASPGETITIEGKGFGAQQDGSLVYYDGEALSPVSWSAGAIEIVVPTDEPDGVYSIEIFVEGELSNTLTHTVGVADFDLFAVAAVLVVVAEGDAKDAVGKGVDQPTPADLAGLAVLAIPAADEDLARRFRHGDGLIGLRRGGHRVADRGSGLLRPDEKKQCQENCDNDAQQRGVTPAVGGGSARPRGVPGATAGTACPT